MGPVGPKFLQTIDLRDMVGEAFGFTRRGTVSKPFQPRLAIWHRLRQPKRPDLRLFYPHCGYRAGNQTAIVMASGARCRTPQPSRRHLDIMVLTGPFTRGLSTQIR